MTDENLGQKIADAVEQVLHPQPTPPVSAPITATLPSIVATARDPITGSFYWPTPRVKE